MGRGLKMHAAQGSALGITRNVRLNRCEVYIGAFERILAPQSGKRATRITALNSLYVKEAVNRRGFDVHEIGSANLKVWDGCNELATPCANFIPLV